VASALLITVQKVAVSIACVSGKGGVGKTTTCSSLAGAFAEMGRRVLAVDMDPQSNLTSGLGFDHYAQRLTVGTLLTDESVNPADVVMATKWSNLFLLPASPDLSAVEAEIPSSINRELELRQALERPGGSAEFDIVLFDTPPNFGFHTVSVMAAVDYILVPVQMSGYAIKGLKEVLRTVRAARQQLNPDLRVLGLVATFVNARTRFSRDMLEGLRAIPNLRVFQSSVTVTVKLQETALAGLPITSYAPSSLAAQSYRDLAAEILTVIQ
jgi:chromosome partitioning protein